jgi:hypothetical protein
MRTATRWALVLAIAAALPAGQARAQTSLRDAKLGTFYTYGLDSELVRLDKIQRVDRIDNRPYVRNVDAGDGRVGYLILTFTVKNPHAGRTSLPALVSTVTTTAGPAIAPAVYGPFVGSATTQADARTPIPAHGTVTLRIAIIDIPNGQRVEELTLSPNDATPAYRYRLTASDIAPLRARR